VRTHGLIHPLWVHIPAGVLAIIRVSIFIWQMVLTSHTAVWSDVPIEFVFTFGIILLSVLVDETWARQEHRKRFNWFSLLDELILSSVASVFITDHMIAIWAISVVSVGAAVVLELFRPFYPLAQASDAHNIDVFEAGLRERFASGKSVAYLENWHPLLGDVLILFTVTFTLTVVFYEWRWHAWLRTIFWLLVTAGAIMKYGGSTISVSSSGIHVRQGIFGWGSLAISLGKILSVAPGIGSPSAYLYGYELWKSAGNRAWSLGHLMYYLGLRSHTVVHVITHSEDEYFIASHDPDRLAAAIRAMKEAADETNLKAEER
jgi:hypothetical protein